MPADPSSTLPAAVHLVQARFLVEIGLEEHAGRARDVPPRTEFSKTMLECTQKRVGLESNFASLSILYKRDDDRIKNVMDVASYPD